MKIIMTRCCFLFPFSFLSLIDNERAVRLLMNIMINVWLRYHAILSGERKPFRPLSFKKKNGGCSRRTLYMQARCRGSGWTFYCVLFTMIFFFFPKSQFVPGNSGMKTNQTMMVITGFCSPPHSGSCSEHCSGHNARFVSDSKTINVIHVCSL